MAQDFLPRERFGELFRALRSAGYRVKGPVVREGAIMLADVAEPEDLPRGVQEHQGPGEYRLGSGPDRYFAWANGPMALKPLTFTPREVLWRCRRTDEGKLHFEEAAPDTEPVAVIGARACDLAGLQLQDAHFLEGAEDTHYAAHRVGLFLVGVSCTHPADTCFCASTGDGPAVTTGYDLALEEVDEGFLVTASGEAGGSVADSLPLEAASAEQRERAAAEVRAAADVQGRGLPETGLRDFLFARTDHPRWAEVAERCLACGNCTSVCPTCFCHSLETVSDLAGTETEKVRLWDSCFTEGHSFLHGIPVRSATADRYRQWLTHKLAGWWDQFGRSGCVGCGRCITWCPTGIDLTEEVAAMGQEGGDA